MSTLRDRKGEIRAEVLDASIDLERMLYTEYLKNPERIGEMWRNLRLRYKDLLGLADTDSYCFIHAVLGSLSVRLCLVNYPIGDIMKYLV